MPNLSSHPVALSSPFFNASATALHPLGSLGISEDGRKYRYAKAGGTHVVGHCLQSAAVIPDHLATTGTATAAGATSLVFTPGATAGAANLYADGYLGISDSAGVGYTYGVAGHAAITASVAFTLNLKADDPIQVALTTGSKLALFHNRYSGVIQMPITTATGTLVGVAVQVLTTGQFGWIQTGGVASVLIAGTPALGAMVLAPGAVAGAAEIMTTTNLVVAQLVGTMVQVGVAGKMNGVALSIAGGD